jgi:hypothetical protein
MPHDFHSGARLHSLGHRMEDGLFIRDRCAYCGLLTVDFCPECGIFVCRRCDMLEHWPAVGIVPDVGFGWARRERWVGRVPRR